MVYKNGRVKMLVDLTAEARSAFPNIMIHNDNDLALVQRMAAGDDAAVRELYAA
jgi:hypothetical protein